MKIKKEEKKENASRGNVLEDLNHINRQFFRFVRKKKETRFAWNLESREKLIFGVLRPFDNF